MVEAGQSHSPPVGVWDYSNYSTWSLHLRQPLITEKGMDMRGRGGRESTERGYLFVEAQHVAHHVSGVRLLQHIPQQTRLRLEQVLQDTHTGYNTHTALVTPAAVMSQEDQLINSDENT